MGGGSKGVIRAWGVRRDVSERIYRNLNAGIGVLKVTKVEVQVIGAVRWRRLPALRQFNLESTVEGLECRGATHIKPVARGGAPAGFSLWGTRRERQRTRGRECPG